jgi:PPOX class probable F420-dependent enzyme
MAVRERQATLTAEQLRFLHENPFVGVVTTLRPDGSPHSTVVWVDVEDDLPSFNTEEGRAKLRHLDDDPRVSLLVVDPSDPYKWVAVDGTADTTTERAREQIDELAKKYLGRDTYPAHNPEKKRVKVLIRPAHVDSSGFDAT